MASALFSADLVVREAALWARLGEQGAAAFDGEGRLLTARFGRDWYRRGLDNTAVALRRAASALRPYRAERLADAGPLLARVRASLPAPASARPGEDRAAFDRAIAHLEGGAAEDVRRFLATVGPVPILPPNHSRAVVLRLTEGCAWNRCSFCTLYAERTFRVRSPEQFRDHAGEVLDWFGRGLRMRPEIYVGDASLLEAGPEAAADALAALAPVLRIGGSAPCRPGAPWFAAAYAFADVPGAASLALAPARRLRSLGVHRLYLGYESGHDGILRLLRKPHRSGDLARAVTALHAAGIAAGVIVLVGAGGRPLREAHRSATVRALATAGLAGEDWVFLSPLDDAARAGPAVGPEPMSDAEQLEENSAFARALRRALPREVRVASYHLDSFVY